MFLSKAYVSLIREDGSHGPRVNDLKREERKRKARTDNGRGLVRFTLLPVFC